METTKKNLRRLFSACAVLLSAAAFAAPQVTTTSGTVKVRPTQPAPADSPVDLIAAKNEFVSFQVVVQADAGGANNVSASLTGLKGAGDIPQSNITLYREGYLNITQPSFPTSPAGMYPDPMIPDVDETVGEKRNAFPFSVPANESRVIWVDVLVPQNANAGAYEGTVTVTGDGFQKDVPVKLNVVNTELPSTSSVNTAFLFAWNNACNVHTGNSECNGDSYALRTEYEKLALEHRITLSNTLIYPGDGNWAAFDQLYAPWIDGTLPTRLPGAKMTTIQFPGPRDPAHYTDFANHFESKGWLSRAYDYTGDEPPFGISFGEALSRAQAVKAAAPKLRTLLTTTATAAEQNGIAQYLDLIVPVVNFMDGVDADHMGDQRATYDNFVNTPGKQLWIYQSCMSHGCAFGSNTPGNSEGAGWPSYMADASAARNRAMQWVVFLENANGELYYETALALDTAWDSIYRFAGNGDGTLFYPGLPSRIGGTTDVPLPSLRMKEIRQAGNKPGGQQPGDQPGANASGAPASRPSRPTDKHVLAGGKDAWGHLPPELRQEIDNLFKEDSLPAAEELIRRYYLSVSRKKLVRGE